MRPYYLLAGVSLASAAAVVNENSTHLAISNDRFVAAVNKSVGAISSMYLDGQDLLGKPEANGGAVGPLLDCYCTPDGFWTPGTTNVSYKLYDGTDSKGIDYAGLLISDTHETGITLETYFFLRGEETGLHFFNRVAYYNASVPFFRNLQELRTSFWSNSPIWTDLLTNEENYAPNPLSTTNRTVVQDETWYLGDTETDPYVQEYSDYFTKYSFHDTWRNHDVHGQFADGSRIADNSTFGAWLAMRTRETYWGGPLHSDLVLEGGIYDYIVSNHHGAQTPNITYGFDRTFGPQYYYFNHLPAGTDLLTAREDAMPYMNIERDIPFYESIADYIPNYITEDKRGSVEIKAKLPMGAKNPIAVLSVSGVDFQDNAQDTTAYQYWGEIDKKGSVIIPRVKADTYRLTIYADGIFGQFTTDNIKVEAGRRQRTSVTWTAESSGKELWRIGTPDKSSGEYKHGYSRDPHHPLHPREHRIYWGAYDFVEDFPGGVDFKVGESDISQDLNYVHWSVFGGSANRERLVPYIGDGNVNNWTISFDLDKHDLHRKKQATFTVQLAGAKTAAANSDVFNASEPHANIKYTVNVNGQDLKPWIIPYYHSSSCAVRSAVICYNTAKKFRFPVELLQKGENKIVLSLPYNATGHETALMPSSIYVQYDALRLEVK